MSQHVFISYARQDGGFFAERIDRELVKNGIRTWRDKRSLDPHQDFTAELEKAIEAAQQVVVCLTPDVRRQDSFVRREIQYALALGKPLLLLRFADVLPPISIITLTYIDFVHQVWDKAFPQLLVQLGKAPQMSAAPDLPADPYRDYLTALYTQIVHYLDRTVFSLIALNTDDTPDALTAPGAVVSALPMAFFDMLPGETFDDIEGVTLRPHDNFFQAFERHKGRALLLGEPGGGKTTTLMAYARDAVARRLEDPTLPLPLVAPVATWDAVQQPALVEWLAGQISALPPAVVRDTLLDGTALLLLDGLDELGSEREHPETQERFDPRQRFIAMLSAAFVQLPASNRLLLTCRVQDYADLPASATLPLNGAVTLRPLDDGQMKTYLAKQPDLLAAIEADPALRQMARTPLILSLFTFAYHGLADQARQLRSLANSPGDLRDKIIETYVRRRYEREARKPNAWLPFSLADVYESLGALALRMVTVQEGLEDSITLRSLSQGKRWGAYGLAPLFTDTHLMEELVVFAAGLNLMTILEEGRIAFIHAMIERYFAAHFALRHIHHEHAPVRAHALYALSKFRDPRYETTLVQALADPSPSAQFWAMSGLRKLNTPTARQTLEQLVTHPETTVRTWAIYNLSRLSPPPDAAFFVNILVTAADSQTRAEALAALERIGTTDALAVVAQWRAAGGDQPT